MGLLGTKQRGMEPESKGKTYKHMTTLETISTFHRKVREEKRESYADVGVLD